MMPNKSDETLRLVRSIRAYNKVLVMKFIICTMQSIELSKKGLTFLQLWPVQDDIVREIEDLNPVENIVPFSFFLNSSDLWQNQMEDGSAFANWRIIRKSNYN